MQRSVLSCAVILLMLMPFHGSAANLSISRRDGFLMIWQGLHRPVGRITEKPFSDVAGGAEGFSEIAFAKDRGILGGKGLFHPEDPLTFDAAFLWLLRSRNTDDRDVLQPAKLSHLMRTYRVARTIGLTARTAHVTISAAQLERMIAALDSMLSKQSHEVSLYSEKFQGKGTACGEAFDMNALTAAHKFLPCNTLVRVTNIENGQSIVVRINDRGPYVPGRDMDLSLAAFTTVADRSLGKIHARFERLGDATIVGEIRKPLCVSSQAYKRLRLRLVKESSENSNFSHCKE